MNTMFDRLGWGVGGAAIVTLVVVLAGVVRAGPLDPPGGPSSTAGVLRPGTPISSLPYTITQPGSYYLTGNLTGVSSQNGINIASNDVTLDLNGFTLQGVADSLSGVMVSSGALRRAITVRNGTARGWGGTGIQAQFAVGGVFDSLTSEGNVQFGISIGPGSTLTHCAATNNGGTGISAQESTIRDCTSLSNGGNGYQIGVSMLTDCIAAHNTFDGIKASNSHITGCEAWQNGTIGINAQSSEVTDNDVGQNTGSGIEVIGSGSLVARNNVHTNSITGTGSGIHVTGTENRIDENHVTDEVAPPFQDVGIHVTGAGNVVVRNAAHANGDNYELTGTGGDYGPLGLAATTTSPWANIDY